MEEDLKILNDYLDENDKKFVKPKRLKFLQAIENLINKYKELEEQIEEYKLDVKEATYEAQENARIFRKEQAKKNEYKKMVELMADSLIDVAFYMDEASEYCEVKKKECDCYQNKLGCKECLLDYFRKKAKGDKSESGNNRSL